MPLVASNAFHHTLVTAVNAFFPGNVILKKDQCKVGPKAFFNVVMRRSVRAAGLA